MVRDEALGFAVGLRSVRTRSEVADPEYAAGDRVDRGAVAGAVVSPQPLNVDAVALVETNQRG